MDARRRQTEDEVSGLQALGGAAASRVRLRRPRSRRCQNRLARKDRASPPSLRRSTRIRIARTRLRCSARPRTPPPRQACRMQNNPRKTSGSAPCTTMSLTHMATRSMPIVSYKPLSMAIFTLVPTPSLAATRIGSTNPAALQIEQPAEIRRAQRRPRPACARARAAVFDRRSGCQRRCRLRIRRK